MLELQTKIKRQIEIVGLCIGRKDLAPLRTPDLADLFDVEELTIKRDLQDLRGYGIDIHSEKKRGVCIGTQVDAAKLRSMVLQYIGLCYSENTFDKSTSVMIRKLKEKALANVVMLQRCVENSCVAVIDYEKESEEIEKNREIQPLVIFQSENFWRVLAVNDGLVKQYHLNKIMDVRPSGRKFKPVPREELDEYFKYTWKSWIGTEKHNVKLKLSKKWADRLLPKQLMEHQRVQRERDGSVVFETTVNSLDEMAGWVVSRGAGVVVLEPEALKEKVVKLAKEAIESY